MTQDKETIRPVPSYYITIMLVVDLLMRAWGSMRSILNIDGITIPDDSYLSLTIARNLAHGLGPLYGEAYTNGYQPLFVLLVTPLYWIWPDNNLAPVHGALLISSVFDVCALWFILGYCQTVSKSKLNHALVGAAWIFSPYVLGTTINGLETTLAFAIGLATLRYYRTSFLSATSETSSKSSLTLGALIGLAVLARIDMAFLGASIFLTWYVKRVRMGAASRSLLKPLAMAAFGAAVVYLPWLIYSWSYTGDLYPISGKAVRFMSLAIVGHKPTISNWYWPQFKSAIFAIVLSHLALILVLLALGVVAWLRKRLLTAFRELLAFDAELLFCLLIIIAYAFYIHGDWFFTRYLFPCTLCLFLALATFCEIALSNTQGRRGQIAASMFKFAVLITLICAPTPARTLRQILIDSNDGRQGYMKLGIWASQNFKPGTIIGSAQTGALGYFAKSLKVVNLDGVVNKECYQSLVENRSMDYIRKTGIEYILGWAVNIQLITEHSNGFRQEDLKSLGVVSGVSSWGEVWQLYQVNNQAR